MSKLQTTFLQNLPAIPLWYNGMWAMCNTKYWTNWPSSKAPVHAQLLAELLPDDEHRHAHASPRRPRAKPAERSTVNARHPSRLASGRGVALRSTAGTPATGAMTRYLTRKIGIYLVTFWVAVTIDWAIPRFMPGDPSRRCSRACRRSPRRRRR